jgi:hypothetical protein
VLLWPDEMMPYQAVANHISSLEKAFDLVCQVRKQIEGSTIYPFLLAYTVTGNAHGSSLRT